MTQIKIPYLSCMRCEHKWIPRSPELPKVCPKCNSPYWNKEYKRSDIINGKKKLTKKDAEEIGEKTELSYEFRNRNRKK